MSDEEQQPSPISESFELVDMIGHFFCMSGAVAASLANGFAAMGQDCFAVGRWNREKQRINQQHQQMEATLREIVGGD